jgi:hypothetical protein
VDNTKKIAEIDEKIRKGEREAFGIDNQEKTSEIDELLLKVNAERLARKGIKS